MIGKNWLDKDKGANLFPVHSSLSSAYYAASSIRYNHYEGLCCSAAKSLPSD
jgi:hypothetical protein